MAITTPLNATNAYGAMARIAGRLTDTQQPAGKAAGADPSSFAGLVRDQIDTLVQQGNATEAMQRDLLAGKADVIDVVTAVSETELALETMVSVRDKVIAAYEEIMRMPI
ncbi:flagellar hook-basal body complex protein FliE [Chthonobacter rhizosphaerae]|uniref:flagellar hook-basal body complex protein FliE n=1 Tax=Chthonobacter rhizosphaerae TaxID=2735553 RepID=UPI0015EF9AE0|nr:flagellar hook-basal body complex protein FliE [Chthonobacter rhizosphaerae]